MRGAPCVLQEVYGGLKGEQREKENPKSAVTDKRPMQNKQTPTLEFEIGFHAMHIKCIESSNRFAISMLYLPAYNLIVYLPLSGIVA